MGRFVACGLVAVMAAAFGLFGGGVAQAGAGEATLEVECTPQDAIAGEDTLRHCAFTATNGSGEALTNAQLSFVPSSGLSIPERYYFFRYGLNGVEQATSSGTQLTFDFGDIAAGETSVIELEVITRTSRGVSGADALFVSYADEMFSEQFVHDRVTVSSEALEGGVTPITVRFTQAEVVAPDDPDGGAAVELPVGGSFMVVSVQNNTDEELAGIEVEVAYGPGVTVREVDGWSVDAELRHATLTIETLVGSETATREIPFEPVEGSCGFPDAAAVATWNDAPVAAIAPFSQIGQCDVVGNQHGGGGPDTAAEGELDGAGFAPGERAEEPVGLPSTGRPDTRRDARARLILLFSALGFAGALVARLGARE